MRHNPATVPTTVPEAIALVEGTAGNGAGDGGGNGRRGQSQSWEGQSEKPPKTGRGKNWEGQENKGDAPPSLKRLPLPKERQKSGRWIEFKPGAKRKDGSRMYYPKWRSWKPGNQNKEWRGPVEDLEPMTLKDKDDYVKRTREAKARRKQRRRTG